jgi:predicted flap endonuclease-1-like 5' DNA nuclease
MKIQTPSVPPSVRYIKGIGPKRAVALERLGIQSLKDLFYFFPPPE